MKTTNYVAALALASLILASCSTGMQISRAPSYQGDDIYFNPNSKYSATEATAKQDVVSETESAGSTNMSELEKKYYSALSNDSVAINDSATIKADSRVSYEQMLRRPYRPGMYSHYYSDDYSDDYGYPSQTNIYLHWSPFYNPFLAYHHPYSWGFHSSWGWYHDPWFWGGGFHHPFAYHYSPFWGSGYPYWGFGGYYGWSPYTHGYNHGFYMGYWHGSWGRGINITPPLIGRRGDSDAPLQHLGSRARSDRFASSNTSINSTRDQLSNRQPVLRGNAPSSDRIGTWEQLPSSGIRQAQPSQGGQEVATRAPRQNRIGANEITRFRPQVASNSPNRARPNAGSTPSVETTREPYSPIYTRPKPGRSKEYNKPTRSYPASGAVRSSDSERQQVAPPPASRGTSTQQPARTYSPPPRISAPAAPTRDRSTTSSGSSRVSEPSSAPAPTRSTSVAPRSNGASSTPAQSRPSPARSTESSSGSSSSGGSRARSR